MHQEIRKWIKENRQPWVKTKDEATKVNNYIKNYYTKKGFETSNKNYEELLDEELIDIYNALLSCLPCKEKEKLQIKVAIGYSRTYEPNASCLKYLDGYAILFDQFFDSLLISLTEQCFSTFFENPPKLSFDKYVAYSNNSIISIFFGLSPYIEPIDTENFLLRKFVNEWVYTITTFILAHEMAHVILSHHNDNYLSKSFYKSGSIDNECYFYNKTIQDEYDADKWAVEFIVEKMQQIIYQNDAKQKDVSIIWGYVYMRLGWLFTILTSIEIISKRIEVSIEDTHPPALMRWEKISSIFLKKRRIHPNAELILHTIKSNLINSASFGLLPPLSNKLMDELYKTRIKHQNI